MKKFIIIPLLLTSFLFSCGGNTGGDATYQVTWDLANGSAPIVETYKKGEMPKYPGYEPILIEKDEEARRNGEREFCKWFEEWDHEIVPVTSNTTYKAIYSEADKRLIVTTITIPGGVKSGNHIEFNYEFLDWIDKDMFINWGDDDCTTFEELKDTNKAEHNYHPEDETTQAVKISIYGSVKALSNIHIDVSGGPVLINLSNTFFTIPEGCFEYTRGIKSVMIPKSVISIGWQAFNGCEDLKTVTFERGSELEKIDSYSFKDTALDNIVIPKTVTFIGTRAFENTKLTEVTIPASVTTIEEGAFGNCSLLVKFNVDKNNEVYSNYTSEGANTYSILEKQGDRLVAGCRGSVIANGTKIIGREAFGKVQFLGEAKINFPSSVVKIESDAFAESNLVEITGDISNVTSVGSYAFSMTKITEVNIPKSVTEIGLGAFTGCTELTKITVADDNPVYEDGGDNGNSIIEKESHRLIAGCTGATIPNTVTSIDIEAFAGMGITSITIPDSVTDIEHSAFYGCFNLEEVNFGTNPKVKTLRQAVFSRSGLTSVTIPKSIEIIGESAFFTCEELTSVAFEAGSQLKEIDLQAFMMCPKLETVNLTSFTSTDSNDVPKLIYDTAFSYCSDNLKFYVISEEVKNAFMNAPGSEWSTHEDRFVVGSPSSL